jgi:type III pantothenate kinase
LQLVIDSGNSRLKMAIFDGNIIKEQKVFSPDQTDEILEFTKGVVYERAIICDTSGKVDWLIEKCRQRTNVLELNSDTPLPIENAYLSKDTLGKDRIAAAVGAYQYFKHSGRASLIIDMGTCITMDVLNAMGTFLGGNISPGILMRIKAMHSFTGKLPLAEVDLPESSIGSSTLKALQNGAIRGTYFEIEGFIRELKQKFGKINVILTGGDAPLFAKFSKNKIFVLPNLVLEGLNEILNYNASKI